MKTTEQVEFWKGKFGDEYTERNSGDWDDFYKNEWGVTRTQLNEEFLSILNKNAAILEFGCNRGNQLEILKKEGFSNLWGLEINKSALNIAREDKDLNLVEASALDAPFKNDSFDLVFTSGVLIHISPENLGNIMTEMHRISKRYIWCFEYYSSKCEEINYRGNSNKLWKNDFKSEFLRRFPDLVVVKEKKIKYLKNDNVDMMFLLEKKSK